MAISTRPATEADAAALHDLAARTFGLATPSDMAQSDIEAFIALHLSQARFETYLTDPQRIVLITAEDGKPVGYSMLVGGPIADPEVAATVDTAAARLAGGGGAIELSKFYVLPGSHGSGLAATLMTATLTAAAGTGAALCWLGVNQRNVRAAKFYTKQGFEIVGTKRFLVGDTWCDDHVRARALGGHRLS
ncbi:GNAT family N-acetyltransferase [Actinoplanes sp. N902-109]|uniref:GNAT family N-acetyltransferase n=1 Tax=Actinoplanes sp. (strain N902-109) TaxID=649831 RepID=UPI0003293873|nr:GNAT family N-acetyltransferase [Actinoplanes sp. N902-109]AGL14869.1 GCN5-like N-acetyltransferase [Actinoplanes sp. N902-109]